MKVIVPMSGLGSRFQEAGYNKIKPLINVHGKPIIAWVLEMFPKDTDFIFICRREHLEKTELKKILHELKPTSLILPIDGHKKGPVYTVSKIYDYLDDLEPYIVTYCDYYMHWDYNHFIESVKQNECDGSVPCYTGFHPHLIPFDNLYAGCMVDENKSLIQVKEKYSFEKNKHRGHHSPGLYYFKNGALLKKYFSQLMNNKISINNEYYVSLVYQLMIEDKLNVYVYDQIAFFCQWGTPYDLEDYLFWVDSIQGKI